MLFYKKAKSEGVVAVKANMVLTVSAIIIILLLIGIIVYYFLFVEMGRPAIIMLICGSISGVILGLIMGEKGAVDSLT
jgi:small-conductance mechanosensitive channel